jgi:predicted nucleotidyltransferase
MLNRTIAIETVKSFVESCKENNVFFQKVILFGSTAQDTTNENSDIDVLLVSDQFGPSKWANLGLIARVNKKYRLIEPHLYPTSSYLSGDPFITEIKQTGVEII